MQPNEQPRTVTTEPDILSRIAEETARIGARYMPTLSVQDFAKREGMLAELRSMLMEGTDYGTIPGTPKPTLYQAGAQKICAFFGYAPVYTYDVSIEDWDGSDHGGEPLFYYRMICTLTKDGKPVGSGPGSCNSWESKYRYRWSSDAPANLDGVATRDGTISEPKFAVDKAETSGPYGKPAEHWQKFKDAIAEGTAKTGSRAKKGGGEMATWEIGGKLYRIPNEGFPDIINTVQKIAAKRAYVGACLAATGASQYFTQDIEDMPADAIGKTEAPAPSSGSQRKQADEGRDDPALVDFLKRVMKGKEQAQEVYYDLCELIKTASDGDTSDRAWQEAIKKVNDKFPSPATIVRSLYACWLGVAEPKSEKA
jgi:hypothetical protein